MSNRRHRRIAKTRTETEAPPIEPAWPESRVVSRPAPRVERLAYTRSQAAAALGLSRSTFIRRVLPYVETVEMPWGPKLIPVDELERLVAERRQAGGPWPAPAARGRPPLVSAEVIERIRRERAAGASLSRIATSLNAEGTPTAHGGTKWWPSTVRAVLDRTRPPTSAAEVSRAESRDHVRQA